MRQIVKALGLGIAVLLMLPAVAQAVAPSLKSVSQSDLRISVTFSAPDASGVTVYVAKAPAQNPDGSFYTQNLADVSPVLTGQQITSGKWTEATNLLPGKYWVMVGANPDVQTCTLGDGTISPTCASGDSRVLPVNVTPPQPRYHASVVGKAGSGGSVSLLLVATPLGVPEGVKLCYAVTVRGQPAKRCLNQHLDGLSWTTSARDQVRLSTRGMSKQELFTWSLAGRTLTRLKVRI